MLYKFVIVIDNSIVTHAKLPKRFEFIPFMYKKVDIKEKTIVVRYSFYFYKDNMSLMNLKQCELCVKSSRNIDAWLL